MYVIQRNRSSRKINRVEVRRINEIIMSVALILTVVVGFFQIGGGEIQRTAAFVGRDDVRKFRKDMAVSADAHGVETSDSPITLSLWLMPPEIARNEIQEQINKFASDDRGPTFVPHVTIIERIPCQSEWHAMEVANQLQEGMKGFGAIPCQLVSGPFTSKGVWNQAFFMVLDMSAPFMNLCQKCRAVLGFDTESWRFAPPADLPHLSLFYGEKNIPDKNTVEAIHPFYSYELALWRTDPQTLNGVPTWKQVATISLN